MLDHLPSFLPNLWNWHINSLLLCVALHLLMWNVLHTFNNFSRQLRNRDVIDPFNDALLNSFLPNKLDHFKEFLLDP